MPFIESAQFRPGLEYRMLSTTDRRMGMYLLIEHGARLDSEFFPESIVRRTWPKVTEYCTFLHDRGVQRVIVYQHYDAGLRKNEQRLLAKLSRDHTLCRAQGVIVTRLASLPRFDVYTVTG